MSAFGFYLEVWYAARLNARGTQPFSRSQLQRRGLIYHGVAYDFVRYELPMLPGKVKQHFGVRDACWRGNDNRVKSL